jgi:hypothetical protein
VVLNISDGGNWIDPLAKQWKLADGRIIEYYHAVEHLHLMTAAVHGKDTPETKALRPAYQSLAGITELVRDCLLMKEVSQGWAHCITNDWPVFDKPANPESNCWPCRLGISRCACGRLNSEDN